MKAYHFSQNQFNRLVEEQTAELVGNYFRTAEALEGHDIPRFAASQQINLFILYQIRLELNHFINQLKHPYFDMEAAEVQQAKEAFRDILSRHIHLNQSEATPLVKKAVYNAVKLIMQPGESFQRFFFSHRQSLPLEAFEQYASYFADFDFIVQGVLAYHKKYDLPEVTSERFQEKMQTVAELYEKKRGISLEDYRKERFQALTGRALDRFSTKSSEFVSMQGKPASAPKEAGEGPANAPTAPPSAASQPPPPAAQPPEPPKATPEPSQAPLQPSEEPSHEDAPAPPKTPEPSAQPDTAAPETSEPEETPPPAESSSETANIRIRNRKLSEEQPRSGTLAERYREQDTGGSVHEQMASKQDSGGELSMDQIPLHKQFQFVQRVFAGNKELFRKTLEALNQCSSLEEADTYMKERILNRPEVSREDRVTQEFMQLLRNKFS